MLHPIYEQIELEKQFKIALQKLIEHHANQYIVNDELGLQIPKKVHGLALSKYRKVKKKLNIE